MKKILCLLLTLSLVVCCLCVPVFATEVTESCTEHSYVNGICSVCNVTCVHQYNDDVPGCDFCSYCAPHQLYFSVWDYNAETGFWKFGYELFCEDYLIVSNFTDGTAEGSLDSFISYWRGAVRQGSSVYLNDVYIDFGWLEDGDISEFDLICLDDVWLITADCIDGYFPFDLLVAMFNGDALTTEFIHESMEEDGISVVDLCVSALESEGIVVNRVSGNTPLSDIGNTLESFLGMVSSAAHAVATNPILLVSFSLSFLCFGIFIFRRIRW